MTSHTRFRFPGWRAHCGALLVTVLLGACAAIPDDSPVVEDLDSETGITIARLGRPVELYRETFRQDSTGRFAFLGPFETNQMGTRTLFLWIAVPVENGSTTPVIRIDGKPLELGEAGRNADFAALRKSPYKIPTPWIAMYYFRLDGDSLARLGAARTVEFDVQEPTKEGGTRQLKYLAQIEADPRLSTFSSR